MKKTKYAPPEKWILWGIPALIVMGFVMAGLQKFTNQSNLIAAFAPVNESIWEHMKLTLYPVAAWWILYYFVRCYYYDIDARKWFAAATIAWIISLYAIPFIFYTYTGSFGFTSHIMNVLILFIAVATAQGIGLYIYRRTKGWNIMLPIIVFLVTITCFTIFTFNPPHIPIFKDSMSGEYGITVEE